MKNIISKCLLLSFSLFIVLFVTACGAKTNETKVKETNSTIDIKTTETITTALPRFDKDYELKYFENDIMTTEEEISDGIVLVKNVLKKNGGNLTTIYALEVDLNKANIVAGTKDNAVYDFGFEKATPFEQATSYEVSTGKKVFAAINADFFGTTCVNAFVKDGYIIKNAHTSTGNFDYLNLSSDVPASAPMLFGIKGNTAQVAPIRSYSGDITSSDVKRRVVTSQLSYKITHNDTTVNSSASLNFTKGRVSLTEGAVYAILDLKGGVKDMTVTEIVNVTENLTLKEYENGIGYIYAYSTNKSDTDFVKAMNVGDKVRLDVKSATGTWNGYDTILGCRQALIIDGAISETVALENTNGAQSPDVPRSAVGVKGSNTVVIFACESMYYGKKGENGDTHGLSLVELADFMRYYGITNGANFDGGGSTQLTIRENDDYGKVIIRSSDTGSYDAIKSRNVMNTLLVVEKE